MIATLGGIGFLQPGYDTQQVNVPGIRRTVESDWFPRPEQPTPVAMCHSQTSSGSTTTSDLIIAPVNAATLLPLLLKVVTLPPPWQELADCLPFSTSPRLPFLPEEGIPVAGIFWPEVQIL